MPPKGGKMASLSREEEDQCLDQCQRSIDLYCDKAFFAPRTNSTFDRPCKVYLSFSLIFRIAWYRILPRIPSNSEYYIMNL